MARTAKIGVPEVRLGAIPGAGGVQKLGRHIGRSRAIAWVTLGRHYTAEEADRAGLLHAVTEPDRLLPEALALAEEIKRLSPLAIAQGKASVYLSEDVDLAAARRFGLEALAVLAGSTDWEEGMAAFMAKRAPRFTSCDSPLEGEVRPKGGVGGNGAAFSQPADMLDHTPHPSTAARRRPPPQGGEAETFQGDPPGGRHHVSRSTTNTPPSSGRVYLTGIQALVRLPISPASARQGGRTRHSRLCLRVSRLAAVRATIPSS